MVSKDRMKWAYFGEIFETVAEQGIDELEAATALLAGLRSELRAFGYRRQYTFNEVDKVERLPRDLHPQPVPVTLWREAGTPKGDLTSSWIDDPEDPHEWILIDWVSGTVESMDWELTNFELLRTDFSGIRISRKEADLFLSELAGKPKKRAGRPQGASNRWERDQVAAALQMIDGGDTRTATAIATSLTDTTLTGKALESQQRRLAWGINAALEFRAKNSANNKRD